MPYSSSCLLLALFVVIIAIAISLLNINITTFIKEGNNYPAVLSLPPPPPLVGPWKPNSILRNSVKRIGDGILPKPKTWLHLDDEIFVGCEDGWIKCVNRSSSSVQNWVRIEGGRPLGLAIGLHRELIVCDPHLGLLNVTEDKFEVLTDEADGLKFKLTDAAIVSRDGSIFFTDASYKYSFEDHILDIREARPHGRLLKYDPKTRSTITLLDNLYFANGVALSGNEDFLDYNVYSCIIFHPFTMYTLARCQRYWLKGEKAGSVGRFIDNLPAFPDNIKYDGKEHFWIGLVATRSVATNVLKKYPRLKSWLSSLAARIMNKRALVLCVTEEGVPMFTLGDSSGETIRSVTTALVVGDDIYLGSLGVDFLGHLKLNEITKLLSM